MIGLNDEQRMRRAVKEGDKKLSYRRETARQIADRAIH